MLINILKDFLSIIAELTVLFVAISFFINITQSIIPYEKIEKYLFHKSFLVGALFTLLFAFITPFCSCSTIPLIITMLNKKMRFGIVMTFLFASPLLDPTILTLMAATLGVKVAITYTVVTSIFSVLIGYILEKLHFEKYIKEVIIKGYNPNNSKFSFKDAIYETFKLMRTVYPYLVLGALIGAIIHGAVPTEFITKYFGGEHWWLIPIAAILGIPLYIRLSTIIPISQILVAKGMALGPVMALMISSTGASLPEITLLKSIFKKELVIIFILSVFTMATLSGTIFYLM